MAHIIRSPYFRQLINENNLWISTLQGLNIRHIEQLASLLLSDTGKLALTCLNLPIDIKQLEHATDKYLRTINIPGVQISASAVTNPLRPRNIWLKQKRGLGHLSPHKPQYLHEISAEPSYLQTDASDLNLDNYPDLGSKSIYGDGALPQVKDQKQRGTCVAFAITSMLEAFIHNHKPSFRRSRNFSEQYLYYRAKQLDREKIEDGTQFEYALEALHTYGICAETYLKYRGFNDWGHALLFDKERHGRTTLDNFAKLTKLSNSSHLPKEDLVNSIKNCIRRNLPVSVGVLVFQDAWLENDYAISKGEIEMPIVVQNEDGKSILMDICTGAHALTIYGYRDDDTSELARPGGGAFIARNSWGEEWAEGNDQAKGYANLPYEYIQKYCIDACIITELSITKQKKITK